MRSFGAARRNIALGVAIAAGCGGLTALPAAAAAPNARARPARSQHHRHATCSPSAGAGHPLILTPCAGATISVADNHNFTVKVRAEATSGNVYTPFIYIVKGGHVDRGLLIGSNGIDEKMHPVHGHPGEFFLDTKSLPNYNYPGFWRVTSGAYRMEVEQITSEGSRYSVIETLHFRA